MNGGPVSKQYQQQLGHADKLKTAQGNRSRLFLCPPPPQFSSLELLGPLVSVYPPELSQTALTLACAPRRLSLLPWSSRCPSPLKITYLVRPNFKICATTSCFPLFVYPEVHAQLSRLHCSQFPVPSQVLSTEHRAQSIMGRPREACARIPRANRMRKNLLGQKENFGGTANSLRSPSARSIGESR